MRIFASRAFVIVTTVFGHQVALQIAGPLDIAIGDRQVLPTQLLQMRRLSVYEQLVDRGDFDRAN